MGPRGSGRRECPRGVQGQSPGWGSGRPNPPEAKASCLNIYKTFSVHVRKSNELDFTHSDSIKSVINKVTIQLFAFIPLNAYA